MLGLKPVKLCGLEVVPVIVGVPVGVNPVVLHSISQAAEVLDHPKSAEVAVMFVVVNVVGAGHRGASSK